MRRHIGSEAQKGAVLVEAAIVLPVLFLIIIGGIALMVLEYKSLVLQNAVVRSAREWSVRTPSPPDTELFQTILDRTLRRYGFGEAAATRVCPVGDAACLSGQTDGTFTNGSQLVVVRADARINLPLLKAPFNLHYSTLTRTEGDG